MVQTCLDLRGSPFLTIAVVSAEVLRAQEEWEAVDNIQPETGNSRNGADSTAQPPVQHRPHVWLMFL